MYSKVRSINTFIAALIICLIPTTVSNADTEGVFVLDSELHTRGASKDGESAQKLVQMPNGDEIPQSRFFDDDLLREQYVEELKVAYRTQLEEMKTRGEPQMILDEHIRQILAPLLPEEPSDWNNNPEKGLHAGAICLIAAEFKSTVPFPLLANRFDFSTRETGRLKFTSPSAETARRRLGTNGPTTLRDYPLMYLAQVCGKDSSPFLKRIIESEEIPFETRLRAFAVLYGLDRTEAESIEPTFVSTLGARPKEALQKYLENPRVEPWKIPGVYSARYQAMLDKSEKFKERVEERRQQGTQSPANQE
ncbi:MAG: hypothetical protein ABIH23_12700 [bacterium]